MSHKTKLSIAALLIVIVGSAVYVYKDDVERFLSDLPSAESVLDKTISAIPIGEVERKVITAEPLRAKVDSPSSFLTIQGIIASTNNERAKLALTPLKENTRLKAAAQAKVRDMFTGQYFDHVSPVGEGPADFVEGANYQYILIGENLALGNFENDRTLVEAWMNSPGHRANIVHTRYTEIGVYVERGVYEGQSVWMAVQEFGAPLSSCPSVDYGIRSRTESNQAQLDAWEAELEERKQDINNTHPKFGPVYEQKVDEYNELAAKYNALVEETRELIRQYNESVNNFNACVAG